MSTDTQTNTTPESDNAPAENVTAPRTLGAFTISTRTAVILLLFTLGFTAMMAGTYILTKGPIQTSLREQKLKTIGEVLPPSSYDNVLLEDGTTLPPIAELGQNKPTVAYRARRGGEPVALVVEAAASDGYSGRIEMILAVRPNGEVIAVRVTDHHETPGLGDYIDIAKDKKKDSPWITQFNNKDQATVGEDQWKVKKDGGQFDQRTGATISARAVTNAVGRAVRYIAAHQAEIFAAPVDKPAAK